MTLDIKSHALQFLQEMRDNKKIPFTSGDTSVGMEYELQVAVEGDQENVDLPITIEESSFYKNLIKKTGCGDLPTERVSELKDFIDQNESRVWENSWVRFPERVLTSWTREILENDFLEDKSDATSNPRSDVTRFRYLHEGEEYLRLPVGYILKLSLANILSKECPNNPQLHRTGKELMKNLLSDNTSPEILSFTIPNAKHGKIGRLAATETARTLLICQLLIQYANQEFELEASGQKCYIYAAPHAPYRQKQLNDIVPDSFYRDLFMSPCLNGWDRGEDKHKYMSLCHQILSRSQLNTINKLKDAGIISNNLIILPNTSSTGLANNGTHVSLGSTMLTELARDPNTSFTAPVEKYFGDLAIKIIEHFLPLFVNTYCAAPYRLDFSDFHPEKVLGFLPHELDSNHLRMLWRRWKDKAKVHFMGKTITPFGPRRLDTLLAKVLHLQGDLVPDFRLIDYLVSLMSTESCPALDGSMENQTQLKNELTEMGVFDSRMSMYLLYRQRQCESAGYTGFEGRSYSLFPSLIVDMAEAVDMQNLITALAHRYIIEEKVKHPDIPDNPTVESERRQIFFGAAIGIGAFYICADTSNRMLIKILSHIDSQRESRRYKGYIRVELVEYQLALLKILRLDGEDLIEQFGMQDHITSLQHRLLSKSDSAMARLVRGTQCKVVGQKEPLALSAIEFNNATEKFYRTELKVRYIAEGLSVLQDNCHKLMQQEDAFLKEVMQSISTTHSPADFIAQHSDTVLQEKASPKILQQLLHICLAQVHHDQQLFAN